MLSKIAIGAILVIIAAGAGVLFGQWLEKPTLDDLAQRNRILAAADSTKEVKLGEGRVLYNRLVRDYNDAEDAWVFITDSLSGVADVLGEKARSNGRTIETLVTANAQLSDSLDSVVSGVVVTDSMVTAELFTYKRYQDGSIAGEGFVTIYTPEDDEPWGNASLNFDIRMTPTVLLSRDENTGLAECDISFGDMPVYMQDLECVNNWDVDLPVRDKIALPSIALGSAITLGLIGVIALIL